MALDFPNSPTIGQTFPNPPQTGIPVWQWDGSEWKPTAPTSPVGALVPVTTQTFTTVGAGTYVPSSPNLSYIEVFYVGGGGGGAGVNGAGAGTLQAGSNGSPTTFNGVTAAGGSGAQGTSNNNPGNGGLGGTGGTGVATRRQAGCPGQGGPVAQATVGFAPVGGASFMGPGGALPTWPGGLSNGANAPANSGGGGGGEFCYLLILNPSSMAFNLGDGGAGGVGTTQTGGKGGSGIIFVIEHYPGALVSDAGAVRFDSVQSLTAAQQKQARQNIKADSGVIAVDRNGVDQTGLTAPGFNKINFNNKPVDANGWFDAVTNFRYTPQIAGTYLVTVATVCVMPANSQSNQSVIYKNGAQFKAGAYMPTIGPTGGQSYNSVAVALVPMNGTTDYIEGWIWVPSTVTTCNGQTYNTYMGINRVGD